MKHWIGTIEFRDASDAIRIRQMAAMVAHRLGYELADQTRLATLASEAIRSSVSDGCTGSVHFFYQCPPQASSQPSGDSMPAGSTVIEVQRQDAGQARDAEPRADQHCDDRHRDGQPDGNSSTGTVPEAPSLPEPAAYLRLADEASWQRGEEGLRLHIRKFLPRGKREPTPELLAAVSETFARLRDQSIAEALESHNREMLVAVGELERRRDELRRVNRELEETNRGVVALYSQLETRTQQLEQAESSLRLAIAAGGMGFWHWRVDEPMVTFDAAGLRLLRAPQTGPQISKREVLDCVHPDDRRGLRDTIKKARDSGEEFEREIRLLPRHPGDVTWLAVRGAASRRHDGRVVEMSGVHFDITRSKTYAEALEKAREAADSASRLKSDLVASVSHELRTPLAAIIGYADLLSENLTDPQQRDFLTTIRKNGQFLLEIINDILDISKIEAGRMKLNVTTFDPREILQDVRTLVAVPAKEKGIELRTRIEGPLPESIQSDPQRVRQIMLNLVGNAVKFTETGFVEVVLSMSDSGDSLRIVVRDTGIGIAPERIGELFEPFTQLNDDNRKKSEGTGLGLAISRRLAHMLGGSIEVDSRVGEGSQFTVTINARCGTVAHVKPAKRRPGHRPTGSTGDRSPRGLDGRTILVVDDDRAIRFLSEHAVRKFGGRTLTANNGHEALSMMRAMRDEGGEPIDLVLMDMQMPEMNGYDATRALRDEGFTQPIIALTAGAMHEERARCIEAGCTQYIAKPIRLDKLADLIQRHLTDGEDSHAATTD